MDNVFIDTCIFEKENFLEGNRIRSILDLGSKGKVQIVLSKITLQEVKARFKKRVESALNKHNEVINDREMIIAPLKNISGADQILQKFPHLKSVCIEFNDKLDEALRNAKAIILDYPVLNIGEIFDKYFQGRYPFNKGDKKSEFPDAFAIAHIEQWCEENNTTCTVFSKDKDFINTSGKRIIVRSDYEQLFINYLTSTQPTRLELLRRVFEKSKPNLAVELNGWFDDQLHDENIYTDIVNWMEIHSLSVLERNVEILSYEVIGVYDETIEVNVKCSGSFRTSLTIDEDGTGFYDKEDGVTYFREQTELEIDRDDIRFSVVLSFYIIDHDEYEDAYETIEINEGKDIEIEDDRWDS